MRWAVFAFELGRSAGQGSQTGGIKEWIQSPNLNRAENLLRWRHKCQDYVNLLLLLKLFKLSQLPRACFSVQTRQSCSNSPEFLFVCCF